MDLQRFHVTLSHSGRPIMHGWWPDLRTAERKFAAWIGERGGMDGESDGGVFVRLAAGLLGPLHGRVQGCHQVDDLCRLLRFALGWLGWLV
ncbi:hypothetical protein ACFYSJ_22355 [Streptomyces sp. NPDC005248]|uniref:hypothetical protein n=1 Tax=Streptomyces sp. NPDC005248 TaxID=3364709 RepID=UPI00368355CB